MAIANPTSLGTKFTSGAGATTQTLTTTSAVSANSLMIVGVASFWAASGRSISSVSASDGTNTNTFTQAITLAITYSGSYGVQDIWYCENAQSLNNSATITVTYSNAMDSGGYPYFILAAYTTGVATASSLDKTASGSASSSTSVSISSGTLSQGNEIIFGFAVSDKDAATYTQATNFTTINNINSASGGNCYLSYYIQAANTSVTFAPSWSISGAPSNELATFTPPITIVSTNMPMLGM